jgi:hypothetical protein
MRWGQNVVVAVVNGGATWGPLLYAVFNPAGGPNVAHLAQGDSSGPVFIYDGTEWKLAGIAASVDSAFNTTDKGPGFNAAIFDGRGLYYGNSSHWKLTTGAQPISSGFQAMRISAHAAWIDGVLASVSAAGPVTSPEPERALADNNSSQWRPPARYRMMLTLAALGNVEKQFQLGTALLQEPDDAAKAEGLKWLDAAAARGSRDAMVLLAQGRDQLVRPERDRDGIRVTCCRPSPGR